MRIRSMAAVAAVAGLLFAAPLFAFNLSQLLGGGEGQDLHTFKLIHVADLAKLMADKDSQVHIFDANPPDTRARFGIIPGAKLLSSDDSYDVVATLPSNKGAKLVFYCADTR
jgi:hypothetical protein